MDHMMSAYCDFSYDASNCLVLSIILWHFAWVVDDAKCIVVMHVCVSVCLSVCGRTPTLLHGPDVTWGCGRGCPLVVHYWADLQLGHGLHCCGNITRTLVTSLRLPRYDDIVRTLGGVCAHCWLVSGGWRGVFSILRAVYGKWAWLAG